MSKRFTRTAAALIVAALAAGCSSDKSGTSATSAARATTAATAASGATETSAATATSGATETSGATPSSGATPTSAVVTTGIDRDATLRFSTFTPMTTADPHAAGATLSTTYFNMMYDRLFWVGRNNQLQPYLVKDWKFGDNTLTLTLRDDATFQDGSPLDATAVKANLDRARTMETSAYKLQLASIQSVDVVDATTVRLSLAPKTGATLPYVLGGWAGMMINPKFMDPAMLKTSAPDGVGSGPYKLVSWTPGDQSVTFERVPTHWDKAAGQAAKVEIYFAADAMQAVNAVTAGQDSLAVQGAGAGAEAIRQAKDSPDKFQSGGWVDTYSSSGFWMRDRVDPIVRQAMSLAIDRDALNALYEGGATTNDQLYPKESPLYSEKIHQMSVHDVDKAKQLIATAPKGSTSLTMAYVESGVAPQIAELFQAQMAEIGVDLTLQPMTQASIYDAWFKGKFDVLSAGTAGPQHPSTGISAILLRGGVNWGAPDSALAEIGAQVASADDPALTDDARTKIYQGILENTAQQNWYLIYNNLRSTTYAAAGIVNVTPELPFQYQSLPDIRYVAKKAG